MAALLIKSFLYQNGYRYYCRRCDRIYWWGQKCRHKSRWWRG